MFNPIHKLLVCFCILPFFFSCFSQTNTTSLIGKFTSEKFNLFEKGLMAINKQRYILNSELNLAADSTYRLSTCGNLINGHWRVSKDSLYLYCEQNILKKENHIKKATPSCSDKPTVFYINSDSKKIKLLGLKKLEGTFAVYNFIKQ